MTLASSCSSRRASAISASDSLASADMKPSGVGTGAPKMDLGGGGTGGGSNAPEAAGGGGMLAFGNGGGGNGGGGVGGGSLRCLSSSSDMADGITRRQRDDLRLLAAQGLAKPSLIPRAVTAEAVLETQRVGLG